MSDLAPVWNDPEHPEELVWELGLAIRPVMIPRPDQGHGENTVYTLGGDIPTGITIKSRILTGRPRQFSDGTLIVIATNPAGQASYSVRWFVGGFLDNHWRRMEDRFTPEILNQYVDKVRFMAWLRGRMEYREAEHAHVIRELEKLSNVDYAYGIYLDYCGERYVFPRPVTDNLVTRFGFGPALDPLNAPATAVPPVLRAGFNQAPFYSVRFGGRTVTLLSDSLYRQTLKARILTLRTKAFASEIEQAARLSCGIESVKGGFLLDANNRQVVYEEDLGIDLSGNVSGLSPMPNSMFLAATSGNTTRFYRVRLSPWDISFAYEWTSDRVISMARITETQGIALRTNGSRWLVSTFNFSDGSITQNRSASGPAARNFNRTNFRIILVSGDRVYMHTGTVLQSFSIRDGRLAPTFVGSTSGSPLVGMMLAEDGGVYCIRQDLTIGLISLSNGGVRSLPESFDVDGSTLKSGIGVAHANNEEDSRMAAITADGKLSFYELGAERLSYSLYIGGRNARIIQALVAASEDPEDGNVKERFIPRPYGVRAQVRVI